VNTRRQFALEGLKQAGLVAIFLLWIGLLAWFLMFIGRILALCFGGGILVKFLRPIWMLATLTVVFSTSVLVGPVPKLLTFYDISDKQLLILACIFVIVYWACIGMIAGLVRRKISVPNCEPGQTALLGEDRKYIRWAVVIMAVILAVISFPSGPIAGPSFISDGRYSAGAIRNAIINELRQVDAAKNEFILEKEPPPDYIVTEADLKPYIKLNKEGRIPRFGPERYVLNSQNEPVSAVFDSDYRIRRRGWHEGFTFTNGTVFRLP
jgi:hypothetical protein